MYIWSPSVEVDNTGKPMKDYIRDHIKPNDREKYYFDSYGPSELEAVIKTTKSNRLSKTPEDIHHILTVIDDFADDTGFTRKSQLLHQLYIRGRHYMISTITSTQVYKQVSHIVRKSMTHLFVLSMIKL